MICYKGKTYCGFYEDCKKKKDCPDILTPDVISKAMELKLPISQFVEKPECHDAI